MVSPIIGIDFGTSNSTCSVFDGNTAHLIPLEDDKMTLPSSMFFADDGTIYFGRESVSAYLDGEEGRFMRGLKSVLGTSLMQEKTRINRKMMSFEEILAVYLRHIHSKAQTSLGVDIDKVVLGRPVHFHDNNPDADGVSENTLRKIALEIGFKDISFQYEPIAAAFAHERSLNSEQLALVVDLGGGTSDFTAIRLSPDKISQQDREHDILATSGVRIGGTNFDHALSIQSFMPHFGLGGVYGAEMDQSKILPIPPAIYHQLSDWPQVNFAQTPKAIQETRSLLRTAGEPDKINRLLMVQENGLGHALLRAVENTKIELTDNLFVDTDLSELDIDIHVPVGRKEFETAISGQIQKIERSIEECISSAQISSTDINLIILTGGSSELPIINQLMRNVFPDAALSNDNKFGSVGLGLAYHAAYI